MAVTITKIGQLDNEAGPKENPREMEYFENLLTWTIDSDPKTTITGWELSGDFPVGVSIEAGLISGVVDNMNNQPSCVPTKPHVYPEVDCRSYPDQNGRYVNDEYDFTFTTTVHWEEEVETTDPAGVVTTEIVPGSTDASHTITLVKDWTTDGEMLFMELLDGALGREPYHCAFSGPSTQEQCELIGGTWDTEHERCSIGTPQDQANCESVGGTWENGKCNVTIIKTREECELIGGTWKKNTLMVDGVEYDNSADFLAAKRGGA